MRSSAEVATNAPAAAHVPWGAPPQGYSGPRRSLILSGGGIRLSYQAGVLRALSETDLCFAHVDATSGGAINLAMLLSGLSPAEMGERWRTLKLKDTRGLM
ncbi:MAG: patatin-like phospholipase family protein, partial [Gemmatimonadota bacterium]|nr:patatin-like phospholipase family protein [Gemmatimonadota bacterium]